MSPTPLYIMCVCVCVCVCIPVRMPPPFSTQITECRGASPKDRCVERCVCSVCRRCSSVCSQRPEPLASPCITTTSGLPPGAWRLPPPHAAASISILACCASCWAIR